MDTEEAARKLILGLESAIERLEGKSALSFSGGIDSTLLLHLSGYSLVPYTIGVEGSRDIENSLHISEVLGFKTNVIEVGAEEVSYAVSEIRKIDPGTDIREMGYEAVLYLSLEHSLEKVMVTGQGADELFYGYRKYMITDAGNQEDIQKLRQRTLPREKVISETLGKMLVTPYLSEDVVLLSEAIGKHDCIAGEVNKTVVRMAMKLSGLPESVYTMKKKAAQYGSGIQKIIRKMAPDANTDRK